MKLDVETKPKSPNASIAERIDEIEKLLGIDKQRVDNGWMKEPEATSIVKDEVTSYSEDSTLHGLRYTLNANYYKPRRLIWIILMCLCMALYYYITIQAVRTFFQFPTIIKVREKSTEEYELPAITFCHYNEFKKSYFSKHLKNNPFPENPEEHLIKGGHQFDDIVERIDFTEPVKADVESRLIPLAASATGFGALCHTIRSFNNGTLTKLTKKSGELIFTINFKTHESLRNEEGNIWLAFHDPRVFPNKATVISKSFEYHIQVSKVVKTSLSSPYGDCIEKDENPLFSVDVYNSDACFSECQSSKLRTDCGCTLIGYPLRPQTPYCQIYKDHIVGELDTKNLTCVNQVFDNLDCSSCHAPCEEDLYDLHDTHALEPITSDKAVVHFGFESFVYDTSTEYAEYPIMSLLGDMGGQLGLCLGASILTVVEMIDLAVHICWKKATHKRARKIKVDSCNA